jgi:hypothetical protein
MQEVKIKKLQFGNPKFSIWLTILCNLVATAAGQQICSKDFLNSTSKWASYCEETSKQPTQSSQRQFRTKLNLKF